MAESDLVPPLRTQAFVDAARRDARATWRFGQVLYYLHLTCRVAALAGAGALPALAGFRARAWTVAISVLVLLCEIVLRVVQPGDHAIHQIRKGSDLKRELRLFDAAARPYDGPDRERRLVTRVETIRRRNDLAEEHVLAATISSSVRDPERDDLERTTTPVER